MYMPTVSVRVEETLLDEARRFGINVSEAFRRGLSDEIRKARIAENIRRLAKIAAKPDRSAVDEIRSLRDGRRR